MRIEFSSAGGALVARLHGSRLDASVSHCVERALNDKAHERKDTLIVNCSEVGFVDSSGLGALAAVLRNLPHTASLCLCEVQPSVMQMFKLARMDRLLSIWRTEPEAVAALADGGGRS